MGNYLGDITLQCAECKWSFIEPVAVHNTRVKRRKKKNKKLEFCSRKCSWHYFYTNVVNKKFAGRNDKILKLRRKGLTLAIIADKFNVSPQRVGQIVTRLNRLDNPGEYYYNAI